MYLSFLRATVQRGDGPSVTLENPTLNSEPVRSPLTRPSIEDTLEITPDQAHALVGIGTLCDRDVKKLEADMAPLVFEARMQAAGSDNGQASSAILAKIDEMKTRRTQIILGYVEQMKAALGDRFSAVELWLRDHEASGYVPAGPAPKKAPR